MLTTTQRLILAAIMTCLVALPSLLLWAALSARPHHHTPAPVPHPVVVVGV